jgi:Uma2 family endonuclease
MLIKLTVRFDDFLKGKPCRLFIAPSDVRLNVEAYYNTVLQPDLFVVCDRKKLDGRACVGAPDFVIEIISPSTAKTDLTEKFKRYLESGVREYWTIDPDSKIITVHILDNGKYISSIYGAKDTIESQVLEDCKINMAEIFAELESLESEE